jgi:guanylate kinase
VIMLGGQARAGKTTLAKWLSEYAYNQGYTPVILPFAGLLKAEAEAKGYSKEKNPEEYRAFCQTLGSNMRQEDADFWVKKFKTKVKSLYEQEQKALKDEPDTWHEKVIIVDDCRYMNELAAARDLRALTIFITPGSRELIEHDAEWRKHESEALAIQIDSGNKDYQNIFHYNIKNDKSLKDFKNKCEDKFEEWFTITAEALLDRLCDCELCLSSREDRDPNGEKVIQDIIDLILEDKDDEDKRRKKT